MTSLSSVTEDMDYATPSSSLGRRDSIVQERFIPDDDNGGNGHLNSHINARRGSYRKEVMMPAWQFFSLIRMFLPELLTKGMC